MANVLFGLCASVSIVIGVIYWVMTGYDKISSDEIHITTGDIVYMALGLPVTILLGLVFLMIFIFSLPIFHKDIFVIHSKEDSHVKGNRTEVPPRRISKSPQ
jgi:uncharacterized membrane protein